MAPQPPRPHKEVISIPTLTPPTTEDWTLQKALAAYPPTKIGPTWQIDETGHYLLPKHTLGYKVLGWMEQWLQAPDGSGDPYTPTPEQARFILWLYAIKPDGSWLYQNCVLQRLKGWGIEIIPK